MNGDAVAFDDRVIVTGRSGADREAQRTTVMLYGRGEVSDREFGRDPEQLRHSGIVSRFGLSPPRAAVRLMWSYGQRAPYQLWLARFERKTGFLPLSAGRGWTPPGAG